MRSRLTDNPVLRNALRTAYLCREKESVGGDWPFGVMRRVREIGPITAPVFWPDFERAVWRLAPVSSVLVLAMVILLLSIGTDLSQDYRGMVMAEIEQPSMGELLGLGG
jgi:hypothetical protein